MCSVMCAVMMDCSKTLRLSSFDRGCPRAHVDVQVPPWCILGASSVPPRCLPGASPVPPCTPRLGPGTLRGHEKSPRILIQIHNVPRATPKMPPKPPMLLHNPSSARFSDPQIHQKCLLVTHTRGKGGGSFHCWLPFFILLAVRGPKLYQLHPTALFPLPM